MHFHHSQIELPEGMFSGAGSGGLSLAIEGPSEAKMTCKDNRDGSCSVEYLPTEPGDYDIGIKFADKHIPGSPFKVSEINSTNLHRDKYLIFLLYAGRSGTYFRY